MDGFSNYDALAGSVKAEDIASDAMNAELLRRIMKNDPSVESLGFRLEDDRDNEYDYFPANAREMGWLGYYVGRNTRIKELYLYPLDNYSAFMDPFCRGIGRNRSIETLEMNGIEGGDLIRMLGPFIRSNHNLSNLYAGDCNLGGEGCRQLSLAIGCCVNKCLTCVTLSGCGLNGDQFADIAIALSMHPKLERLSLEMNGIGRIGCIALGTFLQWSATQLQYLDLDDTGLDDDAIEALASALTNHTSLKQLHLQRNPSISDRGWTALSDLLGNGSCSMEGLYLHDNVIGDETAVMFANALAKNQSLTHLGLVSLNTITKKGWAAFSKSFCDTSSVNKTFLSNHTLSCMVRDDQADDGDLDRYLRFNREEVSKEEIATIKILTYHQDLSMQPFFEWDFKVLPHAVKWFLRAESIGELDSTTLVNIPPRKLSAIYQFVRGMPLLYVESHLRGQLDEMKRTDMKMKQERLVLELQMQELEQRERESAERKRSTMTRLSG